MFLVISIVTTLSRYHVTTWSSFIPATYSYVALHNLDQCWVDRESNPDAIKTKNLIFMSLILFLQGKWKVLHIKLKMESERLIMYLLPYVCIGVCNLCTIASLLKLFVFDMYVRLSYGK